MVRVEVESQGCSLFRMNVEAIFMAQAGFRWLKLPMLPVLTGHPVGTAQPGLQLLARTGVINGERITKNRHEQLCLGF
ncbi:hypothetical protein D5085_02990 [Ectothiorhodospiraceae bacterium BW-2]|nr:hypothetical protein D5085_02520 [Ectothiorhodospiraceae bacterium BW-2]QEP45029.1 hypothetical protein D5085_02990 [Ectothiorhodospiraceae bacterium BW-2]